LLPETHLVPRLCSGAVLRLKRQHSNTATQQNFPISLARVRAPEAELEHPTIPQELLQPVSLA
jgi:hypothetical protein